MAEWHTLIADCDRPTPCARALLLASLRSRALSLALLSPCPRPALTLSLALLSTLPRALLAKHCPAVA